MCLSSEFIHFIYLMFILIAILYIWCLIFVCFMKFYEITYSMNLSSQFINCLNQFLKNWLHIFVHQIAWFVENGTDMYLHCKISPHFSHQRTFPNSPTNIWIYLHKILNWDKSSPNQGMLFTYNSRGGKYRCLKLKALSKESPIRVPRLF